MIDAAQPFNTPGTFAPSVSRSGIQHAQGRRAPAQDSPLERTDDAREARDSVLSPQFSGQVLAVQELAPHLDATGTVAAGVPDQHAEAGPRATRPEGGRPGTRETHSRDSAPRAQSGGVPEGVTALGGSREVRAPVPAGPALSSKSGAAAFRPIASAAPSQGIAGRAGAAAVSSTRVARASSAGSIGAAGRSNSAVRSSGPVRSADAQVPVPRARPFETVADHVAAQIGRGFAAALRQQGGTVLLRLEPDSLGTLRIRMDLEAGRVEATLEASSDRARRLLDDALPSLRSALEAHGLSVERLDVRLAERAGGGQGQDAGGPGIGPDTDGGAGPHDGVDDRSPGTDYPAGARGSDRLACDTAAIVAERWWTPEGVGVGAGGALVRLRLDTVA